VFVSFYFVIVVAAVVAAVVVVVVVALEINLNFPSINYLPDVLCLKS
jgi:hypothetical protein